MPAGHRFTFQRLTPDQVRGVLLSTKSISAIAAETGRSRATIRAVLTGRSHSHLHPDLLRRSNDPDLSCEQCDHWRSRRCGLGHPDPEIEGPGFANDCSTFIPIASAP